MRMWRHRFLPLTPGPLSHKGEGSFLREIVFRMTYLVLLLCLCGEYRKEDLK